MAEPLLIDVAEAARRLGIGHTLARDLIARRELPAVRLGRRVLVPVEELRGWIASRTEGSDTSATPFLPPARPAPGGSGRGRPGS